MAKGSAFGGGGVGEVGTRGLGPSYASARCEEELGRGRAPELPVFWR